jgi:CBS domain containing-hemolysin-like protein
MLTATTLSWILWALLVAGIALSALCSGFETGMYALNPVRLRARVEAEPGGAARRVQALLARREELLVGLLIGNNIANYMATAAVVLLFVHAGWRQHQAESYTTLLLTPIVFVFGEMVPKNLFRVNADRQVYRWAGLVRTMLLILRATGLVALVRGIVALPARQFRSASPAEALGSRDAVRSMLLETAATGTLTPFQAEVADNVLGISAVTLRNVMVPLARVVMISDNYTHAEFVRLAQHFTFSQVPVFARAERSRLLGVVNIDEGLLRPAEGWTPAALMRPIVALDVTLPVMRALTTLREHRALMGAVVDASGRAVGIVTIKDIVEEIVGELAT